MYYVQYWGWKERRGDIFIPGWAKREEEAGRASLFIVALIPSRVASAPFIDRYTLRSKTA